MTAFSKQEGGSHYKHNAIQPIEFIASNGLDYFEGNVVKYICRHRTKGGAADIRKAIHYLELMLEIEYPEKQTTFFSSMFHGVGQED